MNVRSSRRRMRRRGFTLMEVLLVMAILVIIGSLVSVSFISIQKSSKKKGALTQVKMLATACEIYQSELGFPPKELNDLKEPPSDAVLAKKWEDGGGPFIKEALPLDPWGNQYQYELKDAETFRIYSLGPDGQPGGDDIDNLSS